MPLRNVLYGYRVDGPGEWNQGHRFDSSVLLLDPYAKLVKGRSFFGDSNQKFAQFYGTYDFESSPFDWGDDYQFPNIPEVIISFALLQLLVADSVLQFFFFNCFITCYCIAEGSCYL